jgi:hypothetical protein
MDMSDSVLVFAPQEIIPGYLFGDVLSKLAYVDELIIGAEILPAGDLIHLRLSRDTNQQEQQVIKVKAQRVITLMVKGAIPPKVEILEDYLERFCSLSCGSDGRAARPR